MATAKKKQTYLPFLIAAVLVIVGGLGILLALKKKVQLPPQTSGGTQLQVVEGTGRYPQQNQAAAPALQGAARVSDLMQDKKTEDLQGKSGDGLQRSTDLDALLKDSDLKVQ